MPQALLKTAALDTAALAATAQGLSMQPLSQALQECPEQRKRSADIHALASYPWLSGVLVACIWFIPDRRIEKRLMQES